MGALVLLTLVAAASATLSAIAGIGGGTILIAAMYTVGLSPLVALALHAAVQMVSNGSRALAYREHIDWRHGLLCAGVALPIPFLVAHWLVRMDAELLRVLLGVFVLVNLLPTPARVEAISLRTRMIVAGLLKGMIGPVVGASGLILAPFFFSKHWSKEQTVATLALVQTIGHLVKIAAYGSAGVALGPQGWWFFPLAAGVMLGTALGKHWMGRLSQQTFERIFRWVMGLLGLRLLLSVWI